MLKKVISYIEKNKILQDGDSVLLGVSGGADSVCNATCVVQLKRKVSLEAIRCHVNTDSR